MSCKYFLLIWSYTWLLEPLFDVHEILKTCHLTSSVSTYTNLSELKTKQKHRASVQQQHKNGYLSKYYSVNTF
jgi:hypothetical protein